MEGCRLMPATQYIGEPSYFVAIKDGRVRSICKVGDGRLLLDCVCEWALDPTISSMIRVPASIASRSPGATEDQVRAWLAGGQ